MKLTCDLCGGALQMNAGGKDAACKNCGLCYSMDLLRQKLGLGEAKPEVKPAEPVATPVEAPVEPVETPVEEVPAAPAAAPVEAPVAPATEVVAELPVTPVQEQEAVVEKTVEIASVTPVAEKPFAMQVTGVTSRCLVGTVIEGSIGIGEAVYINGDGSAPYRVYRFEGNPNMVRATAGMTLKLQLASCPKYVLKQAKTVNGASAPEENAYHFPGTVEEYFICQLRKYFGEYKLRTNILWEDMEIPVNFMLLKDGYPAIAIFVFDSHDGKSRYQAQKAMEVFGRTGVSCTHFYEEYRNEPAYIVDRIRSAMG